MGWVNVNLSFCGLKLCKTYRLCISPLKNFGGTLIHMWIRCSEFKVHLPIVDKARVSQFIKGLMFHSSTSIILPLSGTTRIETVLSEFISFPLNRYPQLDTNGFQESELSNGTISTLTSTRL